MRVIFMGTPEFAVASLAAILDAGHDVPLVVTVPDRQRGRGLKLVASDVKRFARDRGLEVAQPESLKEEGVAELIRSKRPDVICVVAFRILPESIYSIPQLGSFNLHASLLPKYRGAAPINWAIINGDTETGVTTFFLKRQVDTGDMILQRRVPIGPEMTAGELHDQLMVVGAEAVVETIARIEAGTAEPITQQDQLATPAPKIFRDDCLIDWNQPAERVHDFIRGLSPYPGAFTRHAGTVLKIYRARIDDAESLAPGEVSVSDGGFAIGTSSRALEILEVQQEGKRSMPAGDFVRGYRLKGGERMES